MEHHRPMRFCVVALILFAATSSASATRQTTDSLLRVLDREIARSEQYLALRVERIEHQKHIYYANPTAETAYAVAELYAPYLCDSALRYYQLAQVLCPGKVPLYIETGLNNCRTRMYGGESVYDVPAGVVPQQDTHEYAIYAYWQSDAARYAGKKEEQEEWLIRSAIADVRSGVTDNASSWMLAEIVYDNGDGDLERAYKYVQYSMNNAAIFDARMRLLQISKPAQIISRAYEQQQRHASQRLYIFVVVLLVILAGIAVLTIVVVRQNRRLHSLNRKMTAVNRSLHEANNIKERYISLYLVACADNLRRMAKMAPKATGQTSAQFMESEMPAFYQRFDTSFLSIYPDFVEEFNALLRPEERIYPEKEGALNTELRIFALIRLGITSSTRIAELLCYSANTIYNYRARVKNQALSDRDTFEDRVRRIGTFTE